MKKRNQLAYLISLTTILFALSCSTSQQSNSSLIYPEMDFNMGWKFALNEEADFSAPEFDDSDWREINLPHDWSVEFEFDSVNGEGCTAYLLGGIGWYRKHFTVDIDSNEQAYVLFDGIYNHSEVWINGNKLGYRPYGYVPFYYDLTPFLNQDGENVIAVKVDHSRYADSRWYTGSGIYRNVKLITANKLQIPVWGTFITTPEVSDKQAQISCNIDIQNNYSEQKSFELKTNIIAPDGSTVATITSESATIEAGEKITVTQVTTIENPALWDTESPNLYKAISSVISDGTTIDDQATTFGIRSIHFDAEKGFFLNGKNMKIKGVCLHHDGGLVGTAVPKGVWRRRFQILKDGGCNAIRISHNPGSQEFIELCDEMGMLVQDEFFDEWDYPKDKRLNTYERHDDYITRGLSEYFGEWAEADLKSTMLAHRNNPSIIQWSIGNEIEWTYPRNKKATGFFDMNWDGNYFWSPPPNSPDKIQEVYNSLPALEHNIGETAQKLADWTRELDTTRPVIANCILPSASFQTGYTDALDIVGFSYRRVMYDYAREHYPEKIVMGTENLGQWHEWKAVMERDFISGTFLWTGIDYMGETNAQWPRKTLPSGLIDQAGFTKPSYHMYKTLWSDENHIYLCSQTAEKSQYVVEEDGKIIEKKPGAWENALWIWYDVNEDWNYTADEAVIAEVISNCEEVELFLNDKSLGKKKLADFPDRIYKWDVPFAEGKLTAVGTRNGDEVKTSVVTTGEPTAVKVEVDKSTLNADGYDVAHITVQLIDDAGNPVKNNDKHITFTIDGPVKNLGVDNGLPENVQKYQSDNLVTASGKALLIVQADTTIGKATITVKGDDITASEVSLAIVD